MLEFGNNQRECEHRGIHSTHTLFESFMCPMRTDHHHWYHTPNEFRIDSWPCTSNLIPDRIDRAVCWHTVHPLLFGTSFCLRNTRWQCYCYWCYEWCYFAAFGRFWLDKHHVSSDYLGRDDRHSSYQKDLLGRIDECMVHEYYCVPHHIAGLWFRSTPCNRNYTRGMRFLECSCFDSAP